MALMPFEGSYPITNYFNDPRTRDSYRQRFGSAGHDGIDFALPCGTPVLAPDSGWVTIGRDPGGYGDNVQIRTEGGEIWLLGHFSRVDVAEGAWAEAGQQLGLSGGYPGAPGAGNSSGCHLHASFAGPYWESNRSNGFNGFEDPLPQLDGSVGPGGQSGTQDIVTLPGGFPVQRGHLLAAGALIGAGVLLLAVNDS